MKWAYQIGFITPRTITSFVKEEFNIKISAGTIYPILLELEMNGAIMQLPNEKTKFFVLTERGKNTIAYLASNCNEFLTILERLFVRNPEMSD